MVRRDTVIDPYDIVEFPFENIGISMSIRLYMFSAAAIFCAFLIWSQVRWTYWYEQLNLARDEINLILRKSEFSFEISKDQKREARRKYYKLTKTKTHYLSEDDNENLNIYEQIQNFESLEPQLERYRKEVDQFKRDSSGILMGQFFFTGILFALALAYLNRAGDAWGIFGVNLLNEHNGLGVVIVPIIVSVILLSWRRQDKAKKLQTLKNDYIDIMKKYTKESQCESATNNTCGQRNNKGNPDVWGIDMEGQPFLTRKPIPYLVAVAVSLFCFNLSYFYPPLLEANSKGLADLNLTNANLAGLVAVRADLAGVRFSDTDGAPLVRQDRSGGTCRREGRERKNLQNIHLTRSDLKRTSFFNANLEGADLRYSNLAHARFRFSLLSNVHFGAAEWESYPEKCRPEEPSTLRYACLEGADLSETTINDSDFEAVYALSAKFSEANICSSSFAHGDFTKADFSETRITGTKFHKAQMNKTSFEKSELTNVDFSFIATPNNRAPEGKDGTGAAAQSNGGLQHPSAARLAKESAESETNSEGERGNEKGPNGKTEDCVWEGDLSLNFKDATLKSVDFNNATINRATFHNGRLDDVDLTIYQFNDRPIEADIQTKGVAVSIRR